jgi:hypothetical protein
MLVQMLPTPDAGRDGLGGRDTPRGARFRRWQLAELAGASQAPDALVQPLIWLDDGNGGLGGLAARDR